MTRQCGFTLLEVVLGMALISIVSLSAWHLLDGMNRRQQMVLSQEGKLKDISRVFNRLSDDFSHSVMRTKSNAAALDLQLQSGKFPHVRLLRLQPRTAGVQLEQVEWYLQNDTLYRRSRMLTQGVQFINHRQIGGITGFHLRFYQQGLWRTQLVNGGRLPQAVEITTVVNGLGELQRLTLMGEQ